MDPTSMLYPCAVSWKTLCLRYLILNPVERVSKKVLENAETAGLVREYYFWFFGYIAKLPYEQVLD